MNKDLNSQEEQIKDLMHRIEILTAQQDLLHERLLEIDKTVATSETSANFDWSTYNQEEEFKELHGYSSQGENSFFTDDFAENQEQENEENNEQEDSKEKELNNKAIETSSGTSFNKQVNIEEENSDIEKPLWQHLEELRWVLFKALTVIFIFAIGGLIISKQLQKVLRIPVVKANEPKYDFSLEQSWHSLGDAIGEVQQIVDITVLNANQLIQINNDGVSSAFLTTMKIGLIFGLILSVPFLIYLLWTFISPALKQKEKQLMIRLAYVSSFLFLAGVLFGYAVVYFGIPVLVKFSQEDTVNIWRYMDYVSFCSMLMLAFGLIFELPIFLVGLIYTGLTTTKTLIKIRPYAIVIIFIVAAILTPPDPVSQLSMAIPLCLLYQISIWIGKYYEHKQEQTFL